MPKPSLPAGQRITTGKVGGRRSAYLPRHQPVRVLSYRPIEEEHSMATQSLFVLGASPTVSTSKPHLDHHRLQAAALSRSWRRARRRELTNRWLQVLGARLRAWELQADGAN